MLCRSLRVWQHGEAVLIHSASGGTGQSAIQIAKYIGVEVYATVSSDIKKKWIQDLYEIPENHIFCSRNTAFAEKIVRMTQGRGVDVVLNTLSDEGLVASWECIASFGRFVEIGKKDTHSHSKPPMFLFAKNVSSGAVDIAAMSRERPPLLRKSLHAVMALVTQKQLHATQPLEVYPVTDIEDAFRYMQSGKNMGKAVVNFEIKNPVLTVLDTKPTYYFDTNASYVISEAPIQEPLKVRPKGRPTNSHDTSIRRNLSQFEIAEVKARERQRQHRPQHVEVKKKFWISAKYSKAKDGRRVKGGRQANGGRGAKSRREAKSKKKAKGKEKVRNKQRSR
ncbi:hypothetical protein MMC22_003129 [Lobaria immixta]|nr:hypothetical protein [Lobaria immixta]